MIRYLILLFIALSYSPLAHASTKLAILGDDNYPPYSYLDKNGNKKGIYVRILSEAFKNIKGFDIEIQLLPWKRGLKQMQSAQSFALFPPYYRPVKRPFLTYSAPILRETTAVFCIPKAVSSQGNYSYPWDFKGLKFLENDGFSLHTDEFIRLRENGEIKVEYAASTRMNLQKLLHGRGDCLSNDMLNIEFEMRLLQKEGLASQKDALKFVHAATIASEYGYLAFAKDYKIDKNEKDNFLNQFNSQIRNMQDSGKIQEILDAFLASIEK